LLERFRVPPDSALWNTIVNTNNKLLELKNSTNLTGTEIQTELMTCLRSLPEALLLSPVTSIPTTHGRN
jgi:hypothetical protein